MSPALETWFAYPWLLVALAVVPVLLACFVLAHFRRRRAVTRLGGAYAVRRQLLLRPGVRGWRAVSVLCGTFFLALACAGPQWGREPGEVQGTRGDLVVVLDLSRSMNAEQPSRRERAVRMLRDVADTFQQKGGRRVALVAFAGKPLLLFPLTQDYDHFRHVLARVEADDLPPLQPEGEDAFVSGTRVGAALKLAVKGHDPSQRGRQAILLLSDGDDPADDGEWRQGAFAAREGHLPVHVIGVGDPTEPRPVFDGADYLRFGKNVVRSRLNEEFLQEIARRTGGMYVPAHTQAVPLGVIVESLLDQSPPADDADAVPMARPQYLWFLLPALVYFLLAILQHEGPRRPLFAGVAHSAPAALVVFAFAAPLPDVGDAVRRGNAAYAAGEFEAALQLYEEAEGLALDPGLLAFNRGAALFRLGRFAEAATAYRACLEDEQAPPSRRARASFDLGNALVRQAGPADATLLGQAVSAYRACLAERGSDELWRDARHNLELAQLLWLKARARRPKDGTESGDQEVPSHLDSEPSGAKEGKDKKAKDAQVSNSGEPQESKKGGASDGGEPKQKGRVQAGPLQVLPDQDRLHDLAPDDVDRHLEEAARRIMRQRRQHWQQPARAGVKDW